MSLMYYNECDCYDVEKNNS